MSRIDLALEREGVVRRGIQLFGWQRMLSAIWTMLDYALTVCHGMLQTKALCNGERNKRTVRSLVLSFE